MKNFKIILEMSAECEADARELINDYSGQETSIKILQVEEFKYKHDTQDDEIINQYGVE